MQIIPVIILLLLFPASSYSEEYRICEVKEYGKICYYSVELPKKMEINPSCIQFADKYGKALRVSVKSGIRIVCGEYTITKIGD